ncbi:MAG: DMT family transporter [Caloramator sp.]|nr:DMT family transporter [Caloramator sp.]
MGNNKINKTKGVYADISLFIVAFIWGGGFVAVKNALDNIKPFYMLSIRFILSFIILSIIFNKRIKNITKKDIKSGFIIGIFLFLGFATQTIGLQYTTVGKQSFLTGTYVVIVPFLYWIVSKKGPGLQSTIAAFLTLSGIGLLTLNGKGFYLNKGDALTLICALFFAAQILAIGHYAQNMDPILLSIIQMGFAGFASLIFAVIFEPFPYGINRSSAFAIFYLVIFSTLLAFLVQNVAQKYTLSTHAAIILSLESVFGSILSVIILKEKFTFTMVLGCLFIFLAILLTEANFNFIKKPEKRSIENN